MNNPEISIIMTVFNGQSFIGQTIDSILNQTFGYFELIIVNDNSSDNTREIIERYSQKDSRIITINNPENYGTFISANLGLKIARGVYIARSDSDDISHPTRFENQINFFKSHDEIGLLGTNGFHIDEKNRIIYPFSHFNDDLNIRWGNLFNSQFIHSSIMFRRSLILQAGMYREEFKYAQDYEFSSRLLNYTKGANLQERLIFWRKSGKTISAQKKSEQLNLGTRIAMDNINQLFGNVFVKDINEMLIYRGFYQGGYKKFEEDHVNKYLQILNRFMEVHNITLASQKQLARNVATKMFESIYRLGPRRSNIKYLKTIKEISASAIPTGIYNLGARAFYRLIYWFKRLGD